jgi:hypothetical protein
MTIKPQFLGETINTLASAGWNVRDHYATRHLDFDINITLRPDGKYLIFRGDYPNAIVIHARKDPCTVVVDERIHKRHVASLDMRARAGEAEYRALIYLEAITDFMFAWRMVGPGRTPIRITPKGSIIPRLSPYDEAVTAVGRANRICPWTLATPNDHAPEPAERVPEPVYLAAAPRWVRVPFRVRAQRVCLVDGAIRTGWVAARASQPLALDNHSQP